LGDDKGPTPYRCSTTVHWTLDRAELKGREVVSLKGRESFLQPGVDLRQQQRIVGAAENEGVDERILL
jgi:hypothetical protein